MATSHVSHAHQACAALIVLIAEKFVLNGSYRLWFTMSNTMLLESYKGMTPKGNAMRHFSVHLVSLDGVTILSDSPTNKKALLH